MSRPMKGRKMTPEQCAKFSVAQRARFARQRAKLAAALAEAREAARNAPVKFDPQAGVKSSEKILGGMEPGKWYSTRDMHDVSGAPYDSCKGFAPKWWKLGWLLREQNPDWRPPERPGMAQEPKWLYCLGQEGERRHRAALAVL